MIMVRQVQRFKFGMELHVAIPHVCELGSAGHYNKM